MSHSPNSDTNFFDIVTEVLQGDILAPYPFIICLDYMLQKSIDLKEFRHTHTQGGITFYMKADKSEFTCFKQDGAIST